MTMASLSQRQSKTAQDQKVEKSLPGQQQFSDLAFSGRSAVDLDEARMAMKPGSKPTMDPESRLKAGGHGSAVISVSAGPQTQYFNLRETPNANTVVGNWSSNAAASPVVVSNTYGDKKPRASVCAHHDGNNLMESATAIGEILTAMRGKVAPNGNYEIVACKPAQLKEALLEAAEKPDRWRRNLIGPDATPENLRALAAHVAHPAHRGYVEIITNPVTNVWAHGPSKN